MKKTLMRRIVLIGGFVILVLIVLWGYLITRPSRHLASQPPTPHLNHVFVIMMENHSLDAMSPSLAPYIHQLIQRDGYDSWYFGVTHVSLPNYVALLSGSTHHTHSDNPNQTFGGVTLSEQLTAHHISWQAAMQSLPQVGYSGNWYPEKPGTNPVLMPKNALYAKKHDPFMLFPQIAKHQAAHIVPLATLTHELTFGGVPRFVFITPNLCSDMHGQPQGSRACPSNHPAALVRMGNAFLAKLIPKITHSRAFTGHSVIFITWDEAQTPRQLWNISAWKRWLGAGPQAPHTFFIPVGGGSVPLIALIPGKVQPPHVSVWADHYSLLKTIEAGFGLPYIGQARSPKVQPLSRLVRPR